MDRQISQPTKLLQSLGLFLDDTQHSRFAAMLGYWTAILFGDGGFESLCDFRWATYRSSGVWTFDGRCVSDVNQT